ncbi:MAG: D-amino acid aminotransferase [Betaproteobacteria bacterium]|nr:D-amino acid aminotransferase [Betaproteobacteria bacterium]
MCYLNGEFLPLSEARIPVLDRGFIFGDGVYEVIPVYRRQAFRLAGHLARLGRSLDAVRIARPHDDARWAELIRELVAHQEHDDQSLYLQVTRGVARRDHTFPAGVTPTVFMMSGALTLPPADVLTRGIPAVTQTDNRWFRCDIKSTALLANVLLRQAASDAGAGEAVLLRDGFLTEGSASNIFVVRGGTIRTPAKSHLTLPGITYDVIADLARDNALPYEQCDVHETEVRAADEIWLASSTREILPVTALDGRPVGNGVPGPMFRRMYELFQAYKDIHCPPAG